MKQSNIARMNLDLVGSIIHKIVSHPQVVFPSMGGLIPVDPISAEKREEIAQHNFMVSHAKAAKKAAKEARK